MEGDVDEAVCRRLIAEVNGEVSTVFGRRGKQPLLSALNGYNAGAVHAPWLVLVDLDRDDDCPVRYAETILRHPAKGMCRRVVVRAIEAWILADSDGIARWAQVSKDRIPSDVEGIDDPKRFLVDLFRRSRNRALVEDLVPRQGSGRSVGPGYNSRLREFVESRWDLANAEGRSASLSAALKCIRRLAETHDR